MAAVILGHGSLRGWLERCAWASVGAAAVLWNRGEMAQCGAMLGTGLVLLLVARW